jgi:hypothetical protein
MFTRFPGERRLQSPSSQVAEFIESDEHEHLNIADVIERLGWSG